MAPRAIGIDATLQPDEARLLQPNIPCIQIKAEDRRTLCGAAGLQLDETQLHHAEARISKEGITVANGLKFSAGGLLYQLAVTAP